MEDLRENEMVITFASEAEKNVIQSMIADEAVIYERNLSTLVREYIMHSVMPVNKEAAELVYELYNGEQSINTIIMHCFDLIIKGKNKHIKSEGWIELIELSAELEDKNPTIINAEDSRLVSFYKMYDKAINRIHMQKKNSVTNKAYWASEIDHAEELKNSSYSLQMKALYSFFIKNWEVFFQWDIMYKLLAHMAGLSNRWKSDSATRFKIVSLLKQLSTDWN